MEDKTWGTKSEVTDHKDLRRDLKDDEHLAMSMSEKANLASAHLI